MFFIDIIKKIFWKFNIKKLPKGNLNVIHKNSEENYKVSSEKLTLDFFDNFEYVSEFSYNELEEEELDFFNTMLKTEKVETLLKKVGCKKEVFEKVVNFDDVNIINLKNVLTFLIKLGYNQNQINNIIGRNLDIIYMSVENIENKIKVINNYIQNLEKTKRLIHDNSLILNNNELSIKNVFDILSKEKFSQEEKNLIVEENTNIFFLKKEILHKSLSILKEMLGNNYKKILIYNPSIIGVTDKNFILNEINA